MCLFTSSLVLVVAFMIMNNAFNTFNAFLSHLAPLTVHIDPQVLFMTSFDLIWSQQTYIHTKNDLAFSKSSDSAAILRQIFSLVHKSSRFKYLRIYSLNLKNRPRKSQKIDFLPENPTESWPFWYHSHGFLKFYKLSYEDSRSKAVENPQNSRNSTYL